MSDLLVPNMSKPKVCFTDHFHCTFQCFSMDGRGAYCMRTGNKVQENKLHKDCPLINVDLDAVYRVFVETGDGTVIGCKDVRLRDLIGEAEK